ncbi:MAG: hypothetical protein SGPRY_012942 [Prymnesium sp.]
MLAAGLLLLSLYAAWLVLTHRARGQAALWGPPVAARLTASFCRLLCLLFNLSFRIEFDGPPPSEKRRPFIAVVSPHGCLPLTMIGLGAWRFRPGLVGFSQPELDFLNLRLAAASVLFLLPMLRELLLLCGARDASRRCVLNLLARGCTVAINPGGKPPHI